MLWNLWSVSELQNALNQFDSNLLSELEKIIPKLKGNNYDPTELYRKKNLVKVFEAFAPSDCFNKQYFMRKCLNRLPKKELFLLAKTLNVLVDDDDFEKQREIIVAKRWKSKKFAKEFLDFFNLSYHFMPPEKVVLEAIVNLDPPSKENPTPIDTYY